MFGQYVDKEALMHSDTGDGGQARRRSGSAGGALQGILVLTSPQSLVGETSHGWGPTLVGRLGEPAAPAGSFDSLRR